MSRGVVGMLGVVDVVVVCSHTRWPVDALWLVLARGR